MIARHHDVLWLAGLALLFLLTAATAPINHDESQYVAAIALMREGLPYRDWAYLQTPLQPLLLSPLAMLPAGWLLVGARAANALFALLACALLLRALRGRVPAWAALACVGAMGVNDAWLFGAGVARNDMLPAALLAGALAALLTLVEAPTRAKAALAGLCLGLAISAKISFALPAAGAGLFLLWHWRNLGPSAVVAAVAGGLVGLLPTLVLAAIAPEQFGFGVFTYSLEAPQQFWHAVGEGGRLTAASKLGELAGEAVKGAAPVALLLALVDRRGGPQRLLFDLMLVGGLLAAWLPDPSFRQYLIPLLPILCCRAALALSGLEAVARRLAVGTGMVLALVGVGGTVEDAVVAARDGPPLGDAVERGRIVAAAARGGSVVTLAPETVAGSDVRLDPRFAAGPFLFRTAGGLARRVEAITDAPTFAHPGALDARPPAIVVTGGERKARPPLFPDGIDAPLDRWARDRGYRPVALPGKDWRMWVRPEYEE